MAHVQAFDSTPKKLATPIFALFEIGWIVFTAGFGLLLSNKEHDSILKEDDNRKSPLYFSYYMTLVGGHFVAALGLLHAAMPSGIPSHIIGALSTILNTIYFISVGYVINTSCYKIQEIRVENYHNQYAPEHDSQLVRAVNLMLAGSIILAVSWGLVQLLSFFYQHCPQPVQTRNLWYVISECWKNRTILAGGVSESVRLSSIPAMLLSAIGWCVYVSGLHHGNLWGYTFGGWGASFVPPFMYLASLFRAGYTGKASILMGIFASILNTFFVVGMGASVTYAGSYLYQSQDLLANAHSQENIEEIKEYVYYNRILLGGGMVCLIFWTVVLVLWPFYRPKGTGYSHATNDEIDDNNDLLLPASLSVTHEEHIIESQESIQQPHMEEYRTEANI